MEHVRDVQTAEAGPRPAPEPRRLPEEVWGSAGRLGVRLRGYTPPFDTVDQWLAVRYKPATIPPSVRAPSARTASVRRCQASQTHSHDIRSLCVRLEVARARRSSAPQTACVQAAHTYATDLRRARSTRHDLYLIQCCFGYVAALGAVCTRLQLGACLRRAVIMCTFGPVVGVKQNMMLIW